jgi:myosin XV
LEQEEYAKEKLSWVNVSFIDNKPCIDLISKKPYGIIHILDDESSFPKSTDYSFLDKCHMCHSTNLLYNKPRMSTPEFSIKHYAGEVIYQVKHFLDKNRDLLRPDVVEMFINSRNHVRTIYISWFVINFNLFSNEIEAHLKDIPRYARS